MTRDTTHNAWHILIPGPPVPAPRPRFHVIPTRKFFQLIRSRTMRDILGCFRAAPYPDTGHPYIAWRARAAILMRQSRTGLGLFAEKGIAVDVHLLFVIALPKGDERKTEAKRPPRDWCAKLRGDPDNLAKGPMDAANGILWADDAQVASLKVERVVGAQFESARTEMMVLPLERIAAQRTGFESIRDQSRGSGRFGDAKAEEDTRCPTTEPLPF